MTLTYDLDVEKLDRWYVNSIQVDPTFQGGSPNAYQSRNCRERAGLRIVVLIATGTAMADTAGR